MRASLLLSFILLWVSAVSVFAQSQASSKQNLFPDASPGMPRKRVIHFDSLNHKVIESFMETELPGLTGTDNIVAGNAPVTSFAPEGATNFHLVQDLNNLAHASPSNWNNIYIYPPYAILNDVLYFSAYDGIHGTELWRSDGTETGTYLVKDIYPGSASSASAYITVSGSNLFITANDGTGYGLWKSDGTEAGTSLVKSFSGSYGSSPYMLCDVNGTLYFSISSKTSSDQLWKSDGTTAGTLLAKDFSLESSGKINSMVSAAGLLFFVAYTPTNGYEVWRSDGSTTGTFLMKDISSRTDANDGPAQLTAYNGKLFFSEYRTGASTRRIFQSDGTTVGTTEIAGNYSSLFSFVTFSHDEPFTISNNSLYFTAYSGSAETQVYRYNPNLAANPVLIASYVSNAVPFMQDVSGTLYYTFAIGESGFRFYKVEGNSTSAVEYATVDDLTYVDNNMLALNGVLYFLGRTTAQGVELWVTDGTQAGTHITDDLYTGEGNGYPLYFTNYKNALYYSATDKLHGMELRMNDGTGTKLVKDINTTVTASSYPYPIVPFGNDVLIDAGNYEVNDELWRSDGDTITLVKDVWKGDMAGQPFNFTVKGNVSYFLGRDSGYITSVYKTDGTPAGSVKISQNTESVLDYAVTDDGTLFYITGIAANGNLCKLNTADNTELILNYSLSFHGTANAYNDTKYFTVAGKSVYFDASEGSGYNLWKSDGTYEGTAVVKDIYPGSDADPALQILYHGNVYFAADDGTGTALWKSDGTEAGTIKIVSVQPVSFYIANDVLFFSGYTVALGQELWKTDGTTAGTMLVKDINAGTASSTPARYISLNNVLYFRATDAAHGSELWRSDGTDNGTYLVKDMVEGTGSSSPSYLTVAGGKLFFTVSSKIWMSDGTSTGTGVINDAVANGTYAYYLTGNGNKLFYEGYTYPYGYELYAGDANLVVLPVALTSFTSSLKGSDVMAQWQTSSEVNTSYFNVQRSTDGVHFTTVGKMSAKGSGSTYTYPDVNVANLVSVKTVYYRLQIIDKDGSSSFSKTVPVDLNLKDAVVLLLPNPVKDALKIRVNNYDGKATIGVFDASGKNVYSAQKAMQSGSDVTVNTSSLQSGVYMVKISLNGKTVQQKFIKE